MKWIDIKGPVIANSLYADNQLAARDATITLPSIVPITVDYNIMGTANLPVLGLFQSMEMTVNKDGVDMNLGRLLSMSSIMLETRWVQDTMSSDGTTGPEGCKAFVRGIPKSLPGINVEPGSASESELVYEALRYQLFVGGEELWLLDRSKGIYRVRGVDYYDRIMSLL